MSLCELKSSAKEVRGKWVFIILESTLRVNYPVTLLILWWQTLFPGPYQRNILISGRYRCTVPWCGSLKISPFQPPVFFIGTKSSQTGFDGPVVLWWAQSCYATARPGTGGASDASSPLLLPKENWSERWVQVLKKVSVTIWAGPIRILGWFSRPPLGLLKSCGLPDLETPQKVYCYGYGAQKVIQERE